MLPGCHHHNILLWPEREQLVEDVVATSNDDTSCVLQLGGHFLVEHPRFNGPDRESRGISLNTLSSCMKNIMHAFQSRVQPLGFSSLRTNPLGWR
jgi:hypothetical protein